MAKIIVGISLLLAAGLVHVFGGVALLTIAGVVLGIVIGDLFDYVVAREAQRVRRLPELDEDAGEDGDDLPPGHIVRLPRRAGA